MGYCLVPRGDVPPGEMIHVQRFDARYWTVNFPRPMMGSVVSHGGDAMRVDLCFTARDQLAGLIWEAQDRWSHPLLALETARDFRRCRWTFRWQSEGVKPLDAVHGPTMTIDGRDANGQPRTWYVRLWNYATGSPDDAMIDLDFAAMDGGFLLPGEADPVYAGDIDRIMISLVPPDYDGGTAGTNDLDYAVPRDASVTISAMRVTGSGSVLRVGDVRAAGGAGEQARGVATAYDDLYHLTPARVVLNATALGYQGPILHYVGMSHYFRLRRVGDGWLATTDGGALNAPCIAWHRAFAAEAKAADVGIIWSLSWELLAAHCPPDWMQRDGLGNPALTGWVPPSSLLSPAHDDAMAYLRSVATAFVGIARDAGLPILFQAGEPWWWITPDGRICLYDAAMTAKLGAASVPIASIADVHSDAQRAMLDAAGVLLAQSTAAMMEAVRDAAGPDGATTHLLVYLPQTMDPRWPEARRANLPIGWAAPAFDVLQIEDYDWVTQGHDGARVDALAVIGDRFGYADAAQHYLSGFVLRGDDAATQWPMIDRAATHAARRGVSRILFWALPQIMRDGFHYFAEGEDDNAMDAVDAVHFPIAIGREAEVLTEFSSQIVTSLSGHEQRTSDWADARMRYDAGPGVRSERDVRTMIAFFRARRGTAKGFLFRDPFDSSSAPDDGVPRATDQRIGTGDGVTTRFGLCKMYGDGADAQRRRITRPDATSVTVAVDGAALPTGWRVQTGGVVDFATPPAVGAVISAGFRFDVPVRFAEDQLSVSRATWLAGDMAQVPLIELRDADDGGVA